MKTAEIKLRKMIKEILDEISAEDSLKGYQDDLYDLKADNERKTASVQKKIDRLKNKVEKEKEREADKKGE